MKVKIVIFTLIVSFFVSYTLRSQNSSERKANDIFEMGEYFTALDLYKIAFTKADDDVRRTEITFKIAVCYKMLNDPKEAEQWFKKVIKANYPDPIAILYYADVLKMNGAFEDAIVQYQEYKKLVPDDPRANTGIKSSELSSKWIEKPTRYTVENMATLNSKDSDFGPAYAKKDYKSIYFSSNRSGSKGDEIHAVTGAGFYDIYESSMDKKGKWSAPTPLPGEFLNTPNEEGASCVNAKGSMIYFTRIKVVKNTYQGGKIFTSVKKGTVWGEPILIPIKGTNDSISVGHPSINTDESVMYFSGNLPGGFGGKDIWMVRKEKKGGSFGDPINLGPEINSAGNELYPYIRDNGTLYFSSDYWGGMGGLDIFQADKDNKSGKWLIKNLQYPINSPSDDFGIIFEGKADKGLLTSNRRGGKGADDIYTFSMPPLKYTISGIVKDEGTDEIIPGAKVTLKGSDGKVVEQLTLADGSYKFTLDGNTDYELVSMKEKFLSGRGNESTKGLDENKDFKLDLYMASAIKPIELPNILYDLGKWTLRPESMVSLDKLIETLNDNPNITIELSSHTDFRGKPDANIVLSQKRAQSVVDYLISKGIEADRLIAVGYGQTVPNTVSKKNAAKYSFLKDDDVLTEEFIKAITNKQDQEVCHQINRRTEFKVLTYDYSPKNVNPDNNTQENTNQENNQEVPK